jgi:hypothetical protein
MMEDASLGIGMLKTVCKVAAYPEGAAALRATVDRALGGSFPKSLAAAAGPVLDTLDGVIRVRKIRLDLAHSGPWDESLLAALFATRLASALRQALEGRSPDVRCWDDPVAYMASYVEMQLGLAHEPAWAFPDFQALTLLSPVQASVEIVRARPAVLLALARNGQRSGSAFRFVDRLDRESAARLVIGLLATLTADIARNTLLFSAEFAAAMFERLSSIQEQDVNMRILKMASQPTPAMNGQDMPLMLATAAMAVSAVHVARAADARYGRPLRVADLAASGLAKEALPAHLSAFASAMSRDPQARTLVETIIQMLDRAPAAAAKASPGTGQTKRVAAKVLHLSSPYAGVSLLLPDVLRLALNRHLSVNGLRMAILSVLDADVRLRAERDDLLGFLFPIGANEGVAEYPPLAETSLARVAPESRGLVSGRQGAEGWGDLLLASFASRLPGLRASSRSYLQRQFLAVSGIAEITERSITVTLDGPPLSIVLKMAGLAGDQMPVPHLNNRLLVLKVGGVR